MKLLFFMISVLTISSSVQAQVCSEIFKEHYQKIKIPTVSRSGVKLTDFSKVEVADLLQSTLYSIEAAKAELARIAENSKAPTFKNTILAMENSGAEISESFSPLYALSMVKGTEQTREAMDKVFDAYNDLEAFERDNKKLFQRVQTVYRKRNKLRLSKADRQLLMESYKGYVRSGAKLSQKNKDRLTSISKRISRLGNKFKNNNTIHKSKLSFLVNKLSDLDGVPRSVVSQFKAQAVRTGKRGYLVDLSFPSFMAIMKHAKNGELRKRFYLQSAKVSFETKEYNNQPLIPEIVELRQEMAEMFGYKDYASMALENKMAGDSETVFNFLEGLQNSLYKQTLKENDLVKEIKAEIDPGSKGKLEPWDLFFYRERVKERELQFDEQELKEYFSLENVMGGAFHTAEVLFGVKVKEIKAPTYHKDVKTFKVVDIKTDELMGIFYVDAISRMEGKDGGAWHMPFRTQKYNGRERVVPVSSLVMNFAPAEAGKPVLLTLEDVKTFFHEFGHSLHSMLSDVKYARFSGTSVQQDFVELPSQLMENFAFDATVLKTYAKHYKTGEVLPEELSQIVRDIRYFMAASMEMGQARMAKLDMLYHTNSLPNFADIRSLENKVINEFVTNEMPRNGLISTDYSHIFSGMYAAGYYGYVWSRVLDADIYAAFKEVGVLNPKLGHKLRKYIYSVGGTVKAMPAFINLMGRSPDENSLLRKYGLHDEAELR